MFCTPWVQTHGGDSLKLSRKNISLAAKLSLQRLTPFQRRWCETILISHSHFLILTEEAAGEASEGR